MKRSVFSVGGLAAGIVALAASAAPAFAADYQSRAVGGPGGAPYVMRCAQGDYLVGLSGRSGNWVDAIAPMCARWDAGARAFLPPGIGPSKGGPGGAPTQVACGPTAAITSLFVEQAANDQKTVGLLTPSCATVLTGKRSAVVTPTGRFGKSQSELTPSDPNIGTSAVPYYDSSALPNCGKGDIAVGIYGGAGKYLDRIGLICAPAPRVAADPVVTPPKPADVKISDAARVEKRPRLDSWTCKAGFVWREARPGDVVCVPPDSRETARQENSTAASRVDPKGAYGPLSCKSGFVWREAFDGDAVCVAPERRDAVKAENAAAASRRVGP